MKAVDEDYYRNLVYVLNNDATDLEMTFTMSIDQFEQKKEIELVPGGKDKVVNNFVSIRSENADFVKKSPNIFLL
jgi:preprotein translocase subunit Sec63